MFAVEQQAHHRPALGLGMGLAVPVEVLPGRLKVAGVVGVQQAQVRCLQRRRNLAHGEAQVGFGQKPEQRRHVVAAARIPVAVDDQPVAQILHFFDRHKLEQLGAGLEKAQVARQFVFFAPAAELAENKLDRLGHALGLVAKGKFPQPGQAHQLQGRLKHQPNGDSLHSLPQPHHLVVVKNQAAKDDVGFLQSGFYVIGVGGEVAIAKHPNL